MASGVYEIVNKINGHRYVGSAVNIQNRWREHKSKLIRGRHHSRHLQNAWDKYGAGAFDFNVLELCFPWSLTDREKAWCLKLNHEYCMREVVDSNLGMKHTDEARSIMSVKSKGNKNSVGRIHTPESRAKQSASMTGKKHSPETLARMSAAKQNVSPETRARMSAARKGRIASPETRAKISAGKSNPSPETLAKMSAARKNLSSETRAKLAAGMKGKKHSPETRAKMSAARKGKPKSPGHIEKMIAGIRAAWAKKKQTP